MAREVSKNDCAQKHDMIGSNGHKMFTLASPEKQHNRRFLISLAIDSLWQHMKWGMSDLECADGREQREREREREYVRRTKRLLTAAHNARSATVGVSPARYEVSDTA